MMGVLRVRDGVGRKSAFERAHEEEPQTRCLSHNGSWRQLALVKQMSLPLADMLWTELIGRLIEMLREPLDGADVRTYSF